MNNCSSIDRSSTDYCGWQVITNCSSIKRRSDEAISPLIGSRSLGELCDSWVTKIRQASSRKKVKDTYGGRSFVEAVAASGRLGAELHVLSAGLGLVHEDDEIPNYNLTVSKGQGSIADWLEWKEKSPADWWDSLNRKLERPHPILRLVEKARGVILVLPSTYLQMILPELLMIPESDREKLLVITSPSGRYKIHRSLYSRCLPYDERLDGATKYKGTRNDFPHRALKHLVDEVDFKSLSTAATQRAVLDFLDRHSKPTVPARRRLDDHQIKQIIKKNWQTYFGKRNSLHRFLRDEALVACEQKRFGTLWNQVKQDISRNRENL
jgi:hypothetical protein